MDRMPAPNEFQARRLGKTFRSSRGILPGVTRSVVLQICEDLNLPAHERAILPKALRRVDGLFLSLSSFGIVEAVSIDGESVRQSLLIARIREEYDKYVKRET